MKCNGSSSFRPLQISLFIISSSIMPSTNASPIKCHAITSLPLPPSTPSPTGLATTGTPCPIKIITQSPGCAMMGARPSRPEPVTISRRLRVRACIDCMTAATFVASGAGRVGSAWNQEERGRLRRRRVALLLTKCQLRWCGCSGGGSVARWVVLVWDMGLFIKKHVTQS